jgi:hypothetical protein
MNSSERRTGWVEEEIFEFDLTRRMVAVQRANTVNVGDDASARETSVDASYSKPAVAATPPAEPAMKENKTMRRDIAQRVVVEETAVTDTIGRMLSTVGNHSTKGAANGAEATLPTEREKRGIKPAQPNTAERFNRPDISFASASAWEPSTPNATGTPSSGSVNKKTKQAQLSSVKTEIKACEARKKRVKKGFLIVTLRAKAVVDKWAGLTTES